MFTNENTATRMGVYERITSAIVNAIEAGAGSYRMPWNVRRDKGFSPISVGSVKTYRGINIVVLWAQAQAKGYASALWGTYQQWQALGGQVRRDEHGSPLVYWGTRAGKPTDGDDEDGKPERHLFAKGYTVFNLEQVDSCRLPRKIESPKLSHNQRIERAESFFNALSGLQVRDGGNLAYYRPDVPEAVYMPGFDQFPEPKDFYSVLAHETTHWTSHASRCDRQLGKRFGDEAYAGEELIAELGSAYTWLTWNWR
jgi:antirestriction protein ArdC